MKRLLLKVFQLYSFFCSVLPPVVVQYGPLSWKPPSSAKNGRV